MEPTLARVVVLVVVVAAAAAVAALARSRNGRARPQQNGPQLTAADLEHELGERATLLQFSSTVCAPCRVASREAQAAERRHDGLLHLEVNAERRLDLARRLGVLRTPTTFLLDAQGSVRHRIAGVPRAHQLDELVLALTTTPAPRRGVRTQEVS